MPTSALIRRIDFYAELSDPDRRELGELQGSERRYDRGERIVAEGTRLDALLIVTSGWAYRYRMLEDGRRQVLNVLLPGDTFDLQVMIDTRMDHALAAVTPIALHAVALPEVRRLFSGAGSLTRCFWWTQVQEEAFLREQIVRIGRQTARERIGHLLLELHRRARIVGEADADSFRLPLTQTLIADMLGLTPIHTNRVLRRFEQDGLIVRERGWLTFGDADRLADICHFDPAYFHVTQFERRLRAVREEAN